MPLTYWAGQASGMTEFLRKSAYKEARFILAQSFPASRHARWSPDFEPVVRENTTAPRQSIKES